MAGLVGTQRGGDSVRRCGCVKNLCRGRLWRTGLEYGRKLQPPPSIVEWTGINLNFTGGFQIVTFFYTYDKPLADYDWDVGTGSGGKCSCHK